MAENVAMRDGIQLVDEREAVGLRWEDCYDVRCQGLSRDASLQEP